MILSLLKRLCPHFRSSMIDRGRTGYQGQDWQYVYVYQCGWCEKIWKHYEWQPHPSIRFYDQGLTESEGKWRL